MFNIAKLAEKLDKKPPKGTARGTLWERSVGNSEDFRRVKNLPIKDPEAYDLTEVYRREDDDPVLCKKGCMLCVYRKVRPRLKPAQNDVLLSAAQHNGCLASMGVGHGKTLCTYLLPAAMESKRAVLLVPASVMWTTLEEFVKYNGHWLGDCASFVFSNEHLDLILQDDKEKHRTIVISYERLQMTKNRLLLFNLAPDLIMADECHLLKNKRSARTRRVLEYVKAHPATRFVGLSGTIMTRSILDWAHLARLALGEGAPVPLHNGELLDWSSALDETPREPLHPGILLHLATPEEVKTYAPQDAARRGFGRRFGTTPGIVATQSTGADMSLELNYYAHGQRRNSTVSDALSNLNSLWITPDGREIDSVLQFTEVYSQLAMGFYYTVDWPNNTPDYEWLEANNNLARIVRGLLSRQGRYDSVANYHNAFSRGEYADVQDAWKAWCAVKHRSKPLNKAVWLDDHYIIAIVKNWLAQLDDTGGIIWYSHRAVGELVGKQLGLPVFSSGKGIQTTTHKIVVASEAANRIGKNLQRWNNNLVLWPSRNGTEWEQLIGRTHRHGQLADIVRFWVPQTADKSKQNLMGAISDARCQETTTLQNQKLSLASISGLY